MSRRILCPCGSGFFPNIFRDEIQVLCDDCALAHLKKEAESCEAWVPRSNVIALFRGFASGTPEAKGAASVAVVRGGGGVTPVPLRGSR